MTPKDTTVDEILHQLSNDSMWCLPDVLGAVRVDRDKQSRHIAEAKAALEAHYRDKHLGSQKYQTYIGLQKTLKSGTEIWVARVAYQGQQVYGDIASTQHEAEDKLEVALADLNTQNIKNKFEGGERTW